MLYLIEFPAHGPRLVARPRFEPLPSGGALLVARDAERVDFDLFVSRHVVVSNDVVELTTPLLGVGLLRTASDDELERIVLGRPARAAAETLLRLSPTA